MKLTIENITYILTAMQTVVNGNECSENWLSKLSKTSNWKRALLYLYSVMFRSRYNWIVRDSFISRIILISWTCSMISSITPMSADDSIWNTFCSNFKGESNWNHVPSYASENDIGDQYWTGLQIIISVTFVSWY